MNCCYAPLEKEALLHISGPDALTFLQGQVTCDTRGLEDGGARAGAYCSPQGRVVSDFLLANLGGEHFAMRLRRDTRAVAAATFGKYIVFSKAELDAERDDWQVLACWGPDSAAVLGEIIGSVPGECYGDVRGEGFVLVQVDGDGESFECYLDGAARQDLLHDIGERMEHCQEEQWRCRELRSGIARIEHATSGEFIPQMLNYDLVGHVSFSKGCYTGQEVVARMHYRGKPKRRMYLAACPEAAAAGTPLYTGGASQSVGNVVNSAVDQQAGALALVVATADGVESGLHLATPEGPALDMMDLPYSLESASE